MPYQHRVLGSEEETSCAVGKAVCVGRNYADHVAELNNELTEQPLLFIKPSSACVNADEPLRLARWIDQHDVHHELEIALLVGSAEGSKHRVAGVPIIGVGLALDITLRDVQSELKSKGHPWERAKAFDGSCALSRFLPVEEFLELTSIDFTLTLNGHLQQSGDSSLMLFPITALIEEITKTFSLHAGDVILTGTPKGVSSLSIGDELIGELQGQRLFKTKVI